MRRSRVSVADDRFPEIYTSDEFRRAVAPKVAACTGCNYGSYPEVTLSVRDPRALFSRAATVFFSKGKTVPKRTAAETFQFIDHLREKHHIPPYAGPAFKVKEPSLLQYREPWVG